MTAGAGAVVEAELPNKILRGGRGSDFIFRHHREGSTEAEPAVKGSEGGERWPGCPKKEKPHWGSIF